MCYTTMLDEADHLAHRPGC